MKKRDRILFVITIIAFVMLAFLYINEMNKNFTTQSIARKYSEYVSYYNQQIDMLLFPRHKISFSGVYSRNKSISTCTINRLDSADAVDIQVDMVELLSTGVEKYNVSDFALRYNMLNESLNHSDEGIKTVALTIFKEDSNQSRIRLNELIEIIDETNNMNMFINNEAWFGIETKAHYEPNDIILGIQYVNVSNTISVEQKFIDTYETLLNNSHNIIFNLDDINILGAKDYVAANGANCFIVIITCDNDVLEKLIEWGNNNNLEIVVIGDI